MIDKMVFPIFNTYLFFSFPKKLCGHLTKFWKFTCQLNCTIYKKALDKYKELLMTILHVTFRIHHFVILHRYIILGSKLLAKLLRNSVPLIPFYFRRVKSVTKYTYVQYSTELTTGKNKLLKIVFLNICYCIDFRSRMAERFPV